MILVEAELRMLMCFPVDAFFYRRADPLGGGFTGVLDVSDLVFGEFHVGVFAVCFPVGPADPGFRHRLILSSGSSRVNDLSECPQGSFGSLRSTTVCTPVSVLVTRNIVAMESGLRWMRSAFSAASCGVGTSKM